MPDLSTVCSPPLLELSVDDAVDLASNHAGDGAAAPAVVAAAAESPIMSVECRWSGRVRAFDVEGAVAVTACPQARRGGGSKSASSSSHPAAPAPAPGLTLEDYANEGMVAVTVCPDTHRGGAKKSSSSPSPSEARAPAPGRRLEDYADEGAVAVTVCHEACHVSENKSPASSSVVTPASSQSLEDYEGIVAVTVCPEVRRGGGKKSSSAPPPSSVVAPAPASSRTLEDHVKEWSARKSASGAPLHSRVLPFLTGAPKAVECHLCYKIIYPLEGIKCSVSRCEQMFHLTCVSDDTANLTAESFKCPQHGCMVCKQKMFFWRCGRCTVAAHTKCAPWPLIHLKDDQGSAICWRHPSNWLLQNENADLTNNIEEAFCRLPLPYVNEEFNIDSTIRDFTAIVCKPPSYTHIRRNVYLVKKKRADSSAETGCTNCRADSVCKDDCECRGLSMSCSKNCHCSDLCTNKPFRKDKKIKIVKSKGCGWGAVALEPLEKGDFIIEYVGEVIDDATCEQRLWEMKRRGDKNFYMCEISKDFTIDATFKGNTSRFLNHSCDPNCKLEKWQVDGETRVGVFASRVIEVGEPLTYDYRFVHFGEKVKCHCGAISCQGYLGIQLKNPTQNALAAAALEGQLATQQGSCSPSRLKPETHLLPWTNCIEVPFNLRSKTKIDRLCWGRKRQRTSLIDPSSSSASMQTSVTESAASVP